jgi:kanamycin kinase
MWERVTIGRSGAIVSRRDGVYRKESDEDLVGEGARLSWLREHGIPAARVLDCRPGLLVTEEVAGWSAAEPWPAEARPYVVDALAGLTRALHALPVADCPFDRRLAVTLAAETALTDPDAERKGRTRDELLATRPQEEDLAVCHGDLCDAPIVVKRLLQDPLSASFGFSAWSKPCGARGRCTA